MACLLWQAHPDWTNQHLRDAMDYSAVDLGTPGRDTWYGYGKMCAKRAVDY